MDHCFCAGVAETVANTVTRTLSITLQNALAVAETQEMIKEARPTTFKLTVSTP